jgi:adhesin/invasin
VEVGLTSTVANDVEVSALLGMDIAGELVGTALVAFTPGAVSVAPSGSLLTVGDTTRIAGEEQAIVSVQLRDDYGNNIAQEGIAVRFTTDLGLMNGGVGPQTVQTNAFGVATVSLSSAGAGTATIAAEVEAGGFQPVANPSAVQVAFTAGPVAVGPNGSELERDGSGSLVANGVQDAAFTLQLRDAHGNERTESGVEVRFTTSLGLLNGSSSPVTVLTVGGVAHVTLTSTETGTATVTAEIDLGEFQAVTNGSPISVDFIGQFPDAVTSSIARSPASVAANGVATANLNLTVRDADGIPIAGLIAGDFAFEGLGSAVIDGFSEAAGGVYSFTLTNTAIETVEIVVEADGVALGSLDAIHFIAPGASAGNSILARSPASVLANGVGTSILRLTVLDADGVPLTGLVAGDFAFSGQGSALIGAFEEVGAGVYTFEVAGSAVETVSISAVVEGVHLGSFEAIAFLAPFPDPVASSLSRSPAIVTANGVARAMLTVTALDADGVPVRGLAAGDFIFADEGDATIGGFVEVGDGIYTHSVTNTVAETVSVTVVVDGVALGSMDPITFVAPLHVTTTTLPSWVAGASTFPGSLSATGGSLPYTWNPVAPGELPPGLVLKENGSFGGGPTEVGVYSFTVRVTDANGFTATGEVSVTINPEIVAVPDLRLEVSSNVSEAALGDTIVVTIRVTNQGAGAAENVVLRDDQFGNVQQQIGPMRVTRLQRVAVEVDRGTLNAETGEWAIGLIESRGAATMTVRLVVVDP